MLLAPLRGTHEGYEGMAHCGPTVWHTVDPRYEGMAAVAAEAAEAAEVAEATEATAAVLEAKAQVLACRKKTIIWQTSTLQTTMASLRASESLHRSGAAKSSAPTLAMVSSSSEVALMWEGDTHTPAVAQVQMLCDRYMGRHICGLTVCCACHWSRRTELCKRLTSQLPAM